MSYKELEAETVYTIDQLRLEVEEHQMGIWITDEDGPVNILIAVYLENKGDFDEWIRICCLHPETVQPSSYPAIAVWFTMAVRGNPLKRQEYMFFPRSKVPCIDISRPSKSKDGVIRQGVTTQ